MDTFMQGLIVPFLGTTLGSACVFFLKRELSVRVCEVLAGFAAGVMTAASVWSLLIPSIERSADMGRLAFFPAASGFTLGMVSLLILDRLADKVNALGSLKDAENGRFSKNAMLFLAVTLHNIPEGMAVGVICADLLYGGDGSVSAGAGAAALILGIAIQNFPEGAIISMPLKAGGKSRTKAFLYGALSGAAEPLGAGLTILAAGFVIPMMPYFLSFAAGAMLFVVVSELVPEMSENGLSAAGALSFALGFAAMMTLDTVLS